MHGNVVVVSLIWHKVRSYVAIVGHRIVSSNLVAVVDEFGQGLLLDDALRVCVGSRAVESVLVEVEHDDLRILVLVEAVGVGDFLGHVVPIPARLLDHIPQHLVDSVGLRGFLGLNLLEQFFDLIVLLLILSEQLLRSLVVVSALKCIILGLHISDLCALGLKKPFTGGHQLLKLPLLRLLHLRLLVQVASLVHCGVKLALHSLHLQLRLNGEPS